MKRSLFVILASLSVASIALGGTFTTQSTTIRVPETASGTDSGDTSPTSGSKIDIDARIYLPDGVVAPAPVVIVIPGYADSKNGDKIIALAQDFAADGYVVVTPTVRGFGNSGGKVSLVGPNEINDLKTIITAMQTGTIGTSPSIDIPVNASSKFGVLGPSYGGGHSFEIMRTHVPGLIAVMPIIGWSDLYQALAPNNVPKLSYSLGLFASGFDPIRGNYENVMFDWIGDLLNGKPEKVRTGDANDNIDWRSVIFNPAELTVPTFAVQGWRDYLFPPEQALALVQNTNSIPFLKLYVGGLGHPPATPDIDGAEGLYLREQALRWFEFWLKGVDNGITNEPPVTIAPEDTADWSTNVLIQSSSFPLPGMATATYYINGDSLAPVAPTIGKMKKISPSLKGLGELIPIVQAITGGNNSQLATAILSANAILNDNAADILSTKIFTKQDDGAAKATFLSASLPADLTVIGSPVVQLYVSTKKKNAYYFVQIEERLQNGNAKLVTRGAFEDTSLTPKTVHLISFSPFAINHTFAAGSQIKLRISSRDYPFFLPNLNQTTIKIYRDAGHPSALSLPVVP